MSTEALNGSRAANVAAQIITIPRTFTELGNVSIYSLLERTGYFDVPDHISEADIRAALVCCPECIEEWMQYSEGKRTSGWYITLDKPRYEVGYVSENGHCAKQAYYDNEMDACATFIKHEIENIRLAK